MKTLLRATLLLLSFTAAAHARERLLVMELDGDRQALVERVRLAEAVRRGASGGIDPARVVLVDRRELSTAMRTLGACTEEPVKCATRYGRAMSSVYVVIGDVHRFDDSVEVELTVVDAARGKVLVEATASGRTLDEATKRAETAAHRLVEDALKIRPPRTSAARKAP